MKKIKFVVPYFGKFPSNIIEWIYTASQLEDQNIHFLVFTDLEFPCSLPSNFDVINMSFADIRKLFQTNFDFQISLNNPYKLCDFRPSYGEIFSMYLDDADYWGHCDVDMVWGNIKEFISDEILDTYDKIQYMGHFVLYKNEDRINKLYKMDGAHYSYRKVFSSDKFFSFDEHPGIMSIILKNPIKIFIATNQADFSPAYKRLFVSRRINYNYQIFCWIAGHIYRYYIDSNGKLGRDEFMYAHFQKKTIRGMSDAKLENVDFLISTKGFRKIKPENIDVDFVKRESDYVSAKDDSVSIKAYRRRKLYDFFECSLSDKIIWIKIKMYTRKVNKYFRMMIQS